MPHKPHGRAAAAPARASGCGGRTFADYPSAAMAARPAPRPAAFAQYLCRTGQRARAVRRRGSGEHPNNNPIFGENSKEGRMGKG